MSNAESQAFYSEYVLKHVLPKEMEESRKLKVRKTSLAVLMKFDPDQPRVPKGESEGGQWTSAGGGDKSFDAVEGRLAEKLGMAMTGTNEKGEHQFKVVDEAAFQKAVEEYNKRPDAEGGKVLNTDVARELSPDYLGDRTMSAQVHEPASEFIKELYRRKLAEETPEGNFPTVLFTAGGTGAGKSSGLSLDHMSELAKRSDIIYDTNMNTFKSADAKIQQALASGRSVSIMYVHRDPVDALVNGALPRAMKQEKQFGTGRTVPIWEHAKTHYGALSTVRALNEKYKNDPRVTINAVDNTLGFGNAKLETLHKWQIEPMAQMQERLNEALERQHEQQTISESVYRGFKGLSAAAKVAGWVGPEEGRSRAGSGVRATTQRTSLKGGLIKLLKAGFDPSQERHPAGSPDGGRWVGGETRPLGLRRPKGTPDPESLQLWHGTATDVLGRIMKEGLDPYSHGSGADTYARAMDPTYRPAGDLAVYTTEDKELALWYARMSSSVKNGQPVVLQIRIPTKELSDPSRLRFDEHGNRRGVVISRDNRDERATRVHGRIKPEWIISAMTFNRPVKDPSMIFGERDVNTGTRLTVGGPTYASKIAKEEPYKEVWVVLMVDGESS